MVGKTLVAGSGFGRIYVDAAVGLVEANGAVGQGEQGEVAAAADVVTRMGFGSPLADDDVASDDFFATEFFDAEAFANAIPAIAGSSLSFFVGHCETGLKVFERD